MALESTDARQPVAVIGIALKFPQGVSSIDEFWRMLLEGRCAASKIPKERMNADLFRGSGEDSFDTFSAQGGHFIQDDVASFDAPFFSISPAEAATMDPQQRWLLETAYLALENAGLTLDQISGSRTSVFTGSFTDDYKLMYASDPEQFSQYGMTGISASLLANRLSWFFNFVGASANIDTACSSSLLALDLACQSLLSGDSTMSLVAGCNLMLSPATMLLLDNQNLLSKHSRSYSFDKRADGYARGEGLSVVVLKRLSDAVRDGDTIRAVIRSSHSNQNGHTAAGITRTSQRAQETLIRDTYDKVGLSMEPTKYVEAHGTGTRLGDAFEANAIGNVFRKSRSPGETLFIGAVKSNIGHLEGGSGLAGLVKAILVLEHGIIPPNVNYESPNPRIDTEMLNIKFPLEPTPWPCAGLRRASISGMGFGGSNVHVVIDDAYHYLLDHNITCHHNTSIDPPSKLDLDLYIRAMASSEKTVNLNSGLEHALKNSKLLVWSASSKDSVQRMAISFAQHFNALRSRLSAPDIDSYLEDLAFSLSNRRTSLPWKSSLTVESMTELCHLESFLPEATLSMSPPPRLGLIFTGQGAQWFKMGKELVNYPVFCDSLTRSAIFLKDLGCKWDILYELLDSYEPKVNLPEYSQPLCTAVQIALVDLIQSFGISASVVVGHSSGEIAAAYCIGALSHSSAMKVAYFRGTQSRLLMKAGSPEGTMMAVKLSPSQIQPYLKEVAVVHRDSDLTIACYNSPDNITISGNKAQIDTLHSILTEEKIQSFKLKVNVAYHSPHMQSISKSYISLIQDLTVGNKPQRPITMVSSVTGERVNPNDLSTGDYWVQNLVSPVRFDKALSKLCTPASNPTRRKIDSSHERTLFVDLVIEVGPHAALRGPVDDIITHCSGSQTYMSLLIRNVSASKTVLDVAGRLHCSGYPVDLNRVNQYRLAKMKSLSDLPSYPFDHSHKYWFESRISKGTRFGTHAKNKLLGKPVADWNPLDARWRNFIKLSDLPWIEDHKVHGTVVYPAAGMLVMALEAAKQLADKDPRITAFRIDQAIFDAPLMISSVSSLEVQVSLRPIHLKATDTFNQGHLSFEFRIFSYEKENWIQNAGGTVGVIYDQSGNISPRGHSSITEEMTALTNTRKVDMAEFYRNLGNSGYNYGPSFQVVKSVYHNSNDSSGQVNVLRNFSDAHIIHPTTLDGIFHLIFASLTEGGSKAMETLLPIQIRNIWISSTGLGYSQHESDSVYVHAKYVERGYLGSEVEISVFSECDRTLLARIEGLKFQKMTTSASSLASNLVSLNSKLCRKLEWKPDISLLGWDQLVKLCESERSEISEPTEFFLNLDRLIYIFLRRAITQIESKKLDMQQLPQHIQRYVDWIKRKIQFYESEECGSRIEDDNYVETLSRLISDANNYGKLLVTVGKKLYQLISGQVDPLSFFFQTDPNLLPAAYRALNQISNFMHPLHRYLDHLAHLDPSMRVLEVGAGTGGTTISVLKSLTSKTREPRYATYDFTDLSPAFFETARENFGEFSRVNYKVLDVERDTVEQGYTLHSYDLVIASNVLHATRSLANTLQQVRSLLKPGGKLILMEMIKPDIPRFGFAFGLLEGWWLGVDDSREWSPCISEIQWNQILSQTGFSGNDLIFRDFEDDACHQMSVIISTATMDISSYVESDDMKLKFVLVVGDEVDVDSHLVISAKSHFESFGLIIDKTVSLQTAAEACHSSERIVHIFLLELVHPFLRNISANEFQMLQELLRFAKGILWVTDTSSNPNVGMIDGLARVIRGESSKLVLVTVAFEIKEGLLSQHQVHYLHNILQRTPWESLNDSYETAFVESDGILEVGRITNDDDLSQKLQDYSSPIISRVQRFDESALLEMKVEYPGLLDTIYFAESKRDTSPLAADEIEICVKASGLIFRDVLTALGKLDGGYFGLECAGIVTKVGTNCNFWLGQRVCGLAPSSSRSHVRINRHCAMEIPEAMSFVEAASFPVAFYTAYSTLESARIRAGDSILIHSAAGATGQAAIQISRYFGISEIYATVGTDEKKQLLIDQYNIPDDHIFSSRDIEFSGHIKRATKNGVDIVLNSLSGKGLLASWECLAPYGRFLEIGKSDIIANNNLPMQQFLKNVTFSAFDLSTLVTERPDRLGDATNALETLWLDRKLKLISPLQVYPISEAESAFRLLQSGKSSGKIVLEMKPESLVKVISNRNSKSLFDASKTYVIAGGLGGLGRSIARWMVDRGARFLLLLSRSGSKTTSAHDLIKDLQDKGIVVKAPACDIANTELVKSILAECTLDMPPIGGCIQAAMVLRDSLFENMTFEDWKGAIDPKVNGSWNLHELLPSGLDFFVMLSSNCGILGQVGQANYAAGNTYQDALARYRVSEGEHGISIDLGAMIFEGYVSENEEVSKRLLESGYFHPLTQQDLFALLEHCCDPSIKLTQTDSQIIFGLARPPKMSREDILKDSRISSPLFRGMHTQDTNPDALSTQTPSNTNDFKQQFISAPNIAEAGAIVTSELVKKLSRNLPSMSNKKVDLWQPLMAYGVDSLLSVELRSWFAREFAADVGIFETMNGATFNSIGVTVAKNSKWRAEKQE